jgi:hypothetical protein
MDDIWAITENKHEEDAIMMARNKINCLDDLSLEGNIPDDLLDKYE